MKTLSNKRGHQTQIVIQMRQALWLTGFGHVQIPTRIGKRWRQLLMNPSNRQINWSNFAGFKNTSNPFGEVDVNAFAHDTKKKS